MKPVQKTLRQPAAPAPAPRIPRPGDIYAQRSTDTGRYCAYQITHVENTTASERASRLDAGDTSITLLALDWIGDALPTEAEIAAMRPLHNTRYWFDGSIDHRIVNPPILPATFHYIANRAPLVSKKTTTFGGWPTPRGQDAELEAKWRARDPERLRRFEAARDSEREITLGGVTNREKFFMHAPPELLARLPNLADLDRLPRLLSIEARGPRPDLIPYLHTHDLLHRLTWNAHAQRALDFRGVPHLQNLELDATGLETLHLHKELRFLTLTGTPHPRLRIHAHDDGAQLRLTAPPALAAPDHTDPGLSKLYSLDIENIAQLDLATIVARHPALEFLSLAGRPGTLQNLPALARLQNLNYLYIRDLFGYTPADFPPPGTHPNLTALYLVSIPADVAAHVKKTYAPLKKTGHFGTLQIAKPRAPEWLADNLDNPFRAWDGSEFVTPANFRRATALYKKTRAALRARLAAPDAPKTLPAHLDALVREWAANFNAWDKRANWIETEERETICEVVETLLADAARARPAAQINVPALMETLDNLRDW